MDRVVVTGLGFISSIGNSIAQVEDSLRSLRHGFEPFPLIGNEVAPVKLYGSVKEFDLTSLDHEEWVYPKRYDIKRTQRRTMSPHVLYSHCAVKDAISDAGLTESEISNPRTGLYTASAGSPIHHFDAIDKMNRKGAMYVSPFSVINATTGTINFNLSSSLKIQGAVCGMASACASSAHSLGFAFDEIHCGRQDRMIVIGAEDGNREALLAFAAMRALSGKSNPEEASCPFDTDRSGFVGTGGAAALILESGASARKRKAKVYAEFSGWGQACDGYSPATSHPDGHGLIRAIKNSLEATGTPTASVDYVNAHGTSTRRGDLSEIRALKAVFCESESRPAISSTKALTGHGLSLAGALEAAICCLAIKNGFTPGSAHIKNLEPEAKGLNILRETKLQGPTVALSNNSGFGGANVSLIFRAFDF